MMLIKVFATRRKGIHMDQLTSEHKHFLMEQVRTAKLATVRKDGRPHVTPVWFELDGDTLVFTTWHTSIKAVNIRRDGRVCLCVDVDILPSPEGRRDSWSHLQGFLFQRSLPERALARPGLTASPQASNTVSPTACILH